MGVEFGQNPEAKNNYPKNGFMDIKRRFEDMDNLPPDVRVEKLQNDYDALARALDEVEGTSK